MLRNLACTLFTGIIFWGFSSEPIADVIELRADDWCPYTCASDENQGLLVEIATRVFTNAGHKVVFRTVPWARAQLEVKHHKAHGLVGVTPAEAPSLIYSTEPLLYAENHWFVKADNRWHFDTLASLKPLKLGATEDYSYGSAIDTYIAQNKTDSAKVQLHISDVSLLRNLRNLQQERIDVLLEDCRVVTVTAQQHREKVALRSAGLASRIALYIGFAPDHPKSKHYAQLLNQGMAKLIDSGELAQMLKRYPASLCQSTR
ncbi:ABC transporter substrate-binding protein [Simiduia litorea]|uniref:substrate-binding periplasmic protein n=1 Tax=Simiduia litorea TaxID=1435348 RepID=UPI0036F2636D